MSEFDILVRYRDDVLRAEIAGWLHNIGKLDPNFLVQRTREHSEEVDLYIIPVPASFERYTRFSGRYLFKKFAKPSILQSGFSWDDTKGPLYFQDIEKRRKVYEIENEIKELQSKLRGNYPNKDKIGQRLQQKTNEVKKIVQELLDDERKIWKNYEQRIENLKFASNILGNWPLGSLLTLFWDDWFDKQWKNNYKPGSDDDPDYHRKPKQGIILQRGFSMDFPLLLILAHGEISGQEKKGFDLNECYVKIDFEGSAEGNRKNKEDENDKKDEEDGNKEDKVKISVDKLMISTAFGYERNENLNWKDWPQERKKIIDTTFSIWDNPLQKWDDFLSELKCLQNALGETRRPVNEITLWDYSQAIAALFKTSVVQAILNGKIPTPFDMRWRLVSIRLNAFDFLFEVNQLSDLLARQNILQSFWKAIRFAFEIDIPIGSVVYRDEHGLVFVIPGLLGEDEGEIHQFIEAQIIKEIKKQENNLLGISHLRPVVSIGKPKRGKKLLLGNILKDAQLTNVYDPDVVQQYWSNYQNQERCYVCGLRPVGYMEDGLPSYVTAEKARERNMCGICLAQRGRRSEEWATKGKFKETIWIDEVADNNGRVALVVGKFALDNWLNGTLIRSLAIGKNNEKSDKYLAKPPTFARIQRVWRTTDEFWSEIKEKVLDDLRDDRRRIRLYLERQPDLGAYHAYELDLGKTTMSVVWIPKKNVQGRTDGGYLISIENLCYVAKRLSENGKKEEKDIYKDPASAAIFVEDFIQEKFVKNMHEPVLTNPEGSKRESLHNFLAGNRIVDTDHQEVAYSTAIPIFTDPQIFMALVPAERALEVVREIKIKYEREMGKVRNRLPLYLGVVFAHRRTPLRAILDAGRQMLKQKPFTSCETWTVKSVFKGELPSKKIDLEKESKQFNCALAVELEQNGRSFIWYVPLMMGDGETKDVWYPYVFWKEDASGNTDPLKVGRKRVFEGPCPSYINSEKCWLVHAKDLQKGDKIYFTPATFDFEWLDTNARRFDIAYDILGKRCGRLSRPYFLDDFDRLERLWDLIKKLSISQLRQLIRAIENTREAWYGYQPERSLSDNVFRQFVADMLAGAYWPKSFQWNDVPSKEQKELIEAAVRGELADWFELHMEILREY
ncbi:hypothetical protein [Caldanaerobius polysaccharolyticus]|uniref:hypothetical protein n=1 Tax=Caldanaerobius polysaccharolyticus TaxID=44256 RepID=UPI00068DE58A|nr:hypothetical protein [Caldanaerobius polysaccharolyticus]